MIQRHSERLTRLIDDLLTLSDLELGRTEIRPARCLSRGRRRRRSRCCARRRRSGAWSSRADVADGLPLISGDRRPREQVLINLVDNAIKYSGPGSRVRVAARRVNGGRRRLGGRDRRRRQRHRHRREGPAAAHRALLPRRPGPLARARRHRPRPRDRQAHHAGARRLARDRQLARPRHDRPYHVPEPATEERSPLRHRQQNPPVGVDRRRERRSSIFFESPTHQT